MRIENEDEQQLIAADENLSSVEDVVRVMPTAQYLNVSFNNINSLSGLEQMSELRCLDISHNAVESLQEVSTLSKLLVLKCSSNQIADLSWIAGLQCLEELWLRDNRIESAQLAHLQKLTALQTLVIHPNPCTDRDHYALPILKVLPWLQRVDIVVVTEELRIEARHADERETLDSGATDCTLFSLSGRADDPTTNEDTRETSESAAPVAKPTKPKKQMTAEEFMRAFPVQDFIPLDGTGDAQAGLANRFSQLDTEVLSAETEDNQDTRSPSQVSLMEQQNLQSELGTSNNADASTETKTGGTSALLDSVLMLPTFDAGSFLKKKKPQPRPKVRVKAKTPATVSSESFEATRPFCQDEEHSVTYPNSTVTAIQIRCDGSAIARWPSGSVAVSVDFESSADRSGFRVYAAHKDGQLALSFDPAGVGFLNAYPSGKTLLSTTSEGNGLLFDATNGAIIRQWDAQGRLRDGSSQEIDSLGDEPDGSLLCRLSEYLAVRVQLADPQPGHVKSPTMARRNPIALCIYFAGAPGVRHVFLNSANRAEPSSVDACDYALGKSPVAKAVKSKPAPVEHIDLLSSIRAAVAGL